MSFADTTEPLELLCKVESDEPGGKDMPYCKNAGVCHHGCKGVRTCECASRTSGPTCENCEYYANGMLDEDMVCFQPKPHGSINSTMAH